MDRSKELDSALENSSASTSPDSDEEWAGRRHRAVLVPSHSRQSSHLHQGESVNKKQEQEGIEWKVTDEGDKSGRFMEQSEGFTLIDRADKLSSDVRMRLLKVLVEDGLHSRQFAVGLKTENSLWWYEYAHSNYSRGFFIAASVLFLLMVFVEKPSSNTRSAGAYEYIPRYITLPIEALLLLVVWLDIFAHLRYHGKLWKKQLCRSTWTSSRFFVAVIITLDIATTSVGFQIRFSRPFRVWLLLSRLRNLRNAFSMALRTLPSVSLIGTLVFFLMILFSLIGWLIFNPANAPWSSIISNETKSGLCSSYDDVCNGYFSTFPNALYQMWILLAAVNYPNVMLPYYTASPWSACFFIAYLTIGRIFMMRLLITAAYGAYQEELFSRIEIKEQRAAKAFTATFRIMSRSNGGVIIKDWIALVAKIRPDLGLPVAKAIFNAATGLAASHEPSPDNLEFHSDRASRKHNSAATRRSEDADGRVDDESEPRMVKNIYHFEEMCSMLEVQIMTNPFDTIQDSEGWLGQLRNASRKIYSIQAVRRGFDFLALFSVIRLILVRTGVAPSNGACVSKFVASCTVDILGYFIMGLFAFEQIVKILAFGWREYWHHWLNRLDFFVSLISVFATFLVDIVVSNRNVNIFLIVSQVVPIVRLLRILGKVLRLVRLLRFSEAAKRMLALVTHVVPNAARLLAILAAAVYFFSVVGMESFAGCLSDAAAVNGSSYQVQGLEALNFDTFEASMVTTFTMLIVSKYPVLLEGTVACYGHAAWPMTFYFSFYVLIVCFLLNVFIAFILAVYNEVDAIHKTNETSGDEIRRTTFSVDSDSSKMHSEPQTLISTPKVYSPRIRAQRSWSTHGSVLSSLLASDAKGPVSPGITFQKSLLGNMRARVQSMLRKPEVYATPAATSHNRSAGRNTSGEILLRSAGPKVKDVERLMIKRHRKINSSTEPTSKVTIAVQDSIHRRVVSDTDKARAFAAVQNLAQVLGVEASQLIIESKLQ